MRQREQKKKEIRQWVERWNRIAVDLEHIRRKELTSVNIALMVELLEDAFQSALRFNKPKQTSGLIEQQKWFQKAKI
jgi:hypothetical protein